MITIFVYRIDGIFVGTVKGMRLLIDNGCYIFYESTPTKPTAVYPVQHFYLRSS